MVPLSRLLSNSRRVYTYIFLIVTATLFYLLYIHHSRLFSLAESQFTLQHQPIEVVNPKDENCSGLEGLEDFFIIVRTGSNELHRKLPSALRTTLRCVPHFGIWSDWEETFSGHHIANALDEIDPEILLTHSDFDYYRRLQEHGPDGFDPVDIDSWSQAQNTDQGRDSPGWKLDKWKFLPLAKKAYSQQPSSAWYMFIECDTYVFWDSLVAWISRFDPKQPLWIGRQMYMGDSLFAYGGAGIIFSGLAMQQLVDSYTSNVSLYNELTISQWAGDVVLGRVMSDVGIELSRAWPTLEGDMPATLDFKMQSPTGDPFWCYYATTYHHLKSQDMIDYYDFEQSWKSTHSGFPRNGDVYRNLVYPLMSPETLDQDNLSADLRSDNATFADCHQLCEAEQDCVQFSLNNRTCKTSSGVKLGHKQDASSPEHSRSGWMMGRIEAIMESNEAQWASTDRIAYRGGVSVPSWPWIAYGGAVEFVKDKHGDLHMMKDLRLDERVLRCATWTFATGSMRLETDAHVMRYTLVDSHGSVKRWASLDVDDKTATVTFVVVLTKRREVSDDGHQYHVLFVEPMQLRRGYERLGMEMLTPDYMLRPPCSIFLVF
ncbi:hypothetical protein F5Y18DRAFT_427004 [Xylariaceae sp. FL1019]|nr:hypothetical protein F5Y18DRAFT_427004 [Xylariaceae sp. FL1019]